MALVFDAASNSGSKTSVNSFTWSHTCTGSNGILIVGVGYRDVPASNGFAVLSVTYGASSLTFVRRDNNGASSSAETEEWILVNPPTGANTVTVTFTGGASINETIGGAVSLTSAAQTGQPDSNNGITDTASLTTKSVTDTTVADNAWVVDIIRLGSSPTAVTSTNGTIRTSAGGTNMQIAMATTGPKTPAGAQSVGYSWTTATSAISLSAVGIAPTAAAAAFVLPGMDMSTMAAVGICIG